MAEETCCFNKEMRLPDGQLIKFGRERFEATELLFNPAVDGIEGMGTSQVVFKSINECPMDVRKTLYNNILISGGSSMFPGYSTRLENDIRSIYTKEVLKGNGPIKIGINIIDVPRRKYNVYIGSGVYANLIKDYPD
jgi:actin-related protein 2